MPTYEYRCKTCGEHLEVVQSFTDDALTDCPSCGAEGQLRKVFGSIGITFKGSGFYKTDSRSGSSTSSSSTPSESKGETKGETKSETKAATTSDSSSSKSDSSSSSSTSAA